MKSKILLGCVAVILLGTAAFAADAGDRHSGRVVEIKGQTLVLEEMGPWQGPGTGLMQRTIALTPGMAFRQITPTGKWDNATPGYDVKPIDASALKAGDFVTVVTRGDKAVALDVAQPAAIDAGLASPKTE